MTALSQIIENRKVETRKWLIFREPICRFCLQNPLGDRAFGRTVPEQCAIAMRVVGCRSAVVPCGVVGPRLRRWAPEHVLHDERASALALRSALGLQEGTDIRELVGRVLPGILLLQPFEAL